MKSNRLRMCVVSLALFLIGLILVLFMPNSMKYISLNIMFMAVVILAVGLYIVPFTWSVFITICKKREVKVKADNENSTQDSLNDKDK